MILKPKTIRGKSRGFSIAEAVVGMGVVGIVCVALYSGLNGGIGTVRMNRENERATQIMTEKLDTIRLYAWDKVTTAGYIPTTFTKPFNAVPPGTFNASPGTIYTGSVDITTIELPIAYKPNVRQVTVTLNWTSGSVARQRSMTTLVAKNGMQNYIY